MIMRRRVALLLIPALLMVAGCTHSHGLLRGQPRPHKAGQSVVVDGVTQSCLTPPGGNLPLCLLCIGTRLNDPRAICGPIEYPRLATAQFGFSRAGGERIKARLVYQPGGGFRWQPMLLNGKASPAR